MSPTTTPTLDLPLQERLRAADADVERALEHTVEALPALDEEASTLTAEWRDFKDLPAIETPEQAAQVRLLMDSAKAAIDRIKTELDPVRQLQHKAWKGTVSAINNLTAGPERIKERASRLLGAYQRRLEADARRERLRLEAEARARAEEEAEETAEALLEAGHDDEALAVLEQPVAPPPVPQPRVKKVAVATVDYWKFRLGATPERPATWEIAVVEALQRYRGNIGQGLRDLFGVEPPFLVPDEKSIGQEVRRIKDEKTISRVCGPAVEPYKESKAR